jgi:hypothetical protein
LNEVAKKKKENLCSTAAMNLNLKAHERNINDFVGDLQMSAASRLPRHNTSQQSAFGKLAL